LGNAMFHPGPHLPVRRQGNAREMGGAAMKLSGVRFRVSGLKPEH
jgi:hypothetical protein